MIKNIKNSQDSSAVKWFLENIQVYIKTKGRSLLSIFIKLLKFSSEIYLALMVVSDSKADRYFTVGLGGCLLSF